MNYTLVIMIAVNFLFEMKQHEQSNTIFIIYAYIYIYEYEVYIIWIFEVTTLLITGHLIITITYNRPPDYNNIYMDMKFIFYEYLK